MHMYVRYKWRYEFVYAKHVPATASQIDRLPENECYVIFSTFANICDDH